jgi:hypothetical protein
MFSQRRPVRYRHCMGQTFAQFQRPGNTLFLKPAYLAYEIGFLLFFLRLALFGNLYFSQFSIVMAKALLTPIQYNVFVFQSTTTQL